MTLLSLFKKTPKIKAPLSFHNTLSGHIEPFVPLNGGPVRMYNCGPTVYDFQHIGNLKAAVVADLIRRALALWGYRTKQVINFTDVGHLTGDNEGDADQGEDRMEKGARTFGTSIEEVVEKIVSAYLADLQALGINTNAIVFPRATHYIGEQIALVKALEEKGYTYVIDDGVYFDTSKFKEYGKLGHINLSGMEEGARIGVIAGKRNPTDFALWKFSPQSEKRLQEWESPWGVGFPGWHLECTAMIFKLLGKQIDIHTGGTEHIPVHHNNEIAQAEGATGKQYVKYWMHHALITIEGKKISKSLGNTIYLRNIIERGFNPLAYRYLLLTAHYRTPLNFSWTALEAAAAALTRLQRIFFEDLPKHGEPSSAFIEAFTDALGKDLDTPKALALVWEMLRDEKVSTAQMRGNLLYADRIFALGLDRPAGEMKSLAVAELKSLPPDVQTSIEARESARVARNFAEADRIRDELKALGYEIEDGENGPSVRHIGSL